MPRSAGQELAEITKDLARTVIAWVDAGYPFDGPIFEEREAVFRRLHVWNALHGGAESPAPPCSPEPHLPLEFVQQRTDSRG